MTIRIVLADDHPVVRFGLRTLLDDEPDLEVVGEAGDGRQAVDMCRVHRPDVVLMDLRMPRMDGTSATAALSAELPEIGVVVLTTYDTDGDILRAVEAGAKGYLLKDTPRDVLTAAVRAAARGETVLAPPVAARLMQRLRSPSADALSRREVEVLRAVARGRTNAQIGRELSISEATVKTHLLRAFAKLGVDDRTHAVTVAMQRGLLETPEAGGRHQEH